MNNEIGYSWSPRDTHIMDICHNYNSHNIQCTTSNYTTKLVSGVPLNSHHRAMNVICTALYTTTLKLCFVIPWQQQLHYVIPAEFNFRYK